MDIAMPEGTSIIAVRDGAVVKIENNQNGRGDNPSGSFVHILHDDGAMGVYLYLIRHSVPVTEDRRAQVGTSLACSDSTGNGSGPHLHFVIQRNVGLALESTPYDFAQPVDSPPSLTIVCEL